MKALIVAENNVTMTTFSNFLTECGFDVIKYAWLMKALDNIEEIAPHLVLISASDYPRHWKTFVQFMQSTLIHQRPAVFVAAEDIYLFSDEEKKKAQALGVAALISESLTDSEKQLITEICPITKTENTVQKNIKSTPEVHVQKNTLIINHPSLSFQITGTVGEYAHPVFNFYPADPSLMQTIRFGQILQNCVFTWNGTEQRVKVQVRGTGLKIEMCILT